MPNTFFGLTIGTTGMYGANIGINTTAHNISNTETEGYSRQTVKAQAGVPLRANGTYGMIGTGVDILSIDQQRDEYYDCKYRSNNTLAGYYDQQQYYMQSVENYFNEITLEGFTTTLNKFYDSLQELSKNPASLTVRTQVNNFASSFCDYINSISNSMEQLQENANFEINTQVSSLNSYAIQIAGLTKQINTLEITGEKANDLRDQRALLVDKLSNIVDISVTENQVGQAESGVSSYTIKVGETTLVDTFVAHSMEIKPREKKVNQSDLDGLYDIVWDSGQSYNALTGGGRLQALMEVRDGNNEQYFNGRTTAGYGDDTIIVTDTSINKTEQLHIDSTGVITIGNREYTYNGFQVTEDEDGNYVYEFALDTPLTRDVDETEVRIGRSIEYKGISYYMCQLDEFTRTFSKKFNEIHRSGTDLYNKQGIDYFNSKDKVSGEDYVFEYTEDEIDREIIINSRTGAYAVEEGMEDKNYAGYYSMTASRLSVTKELYDDPSKLAAASDVINGVEKNDIAIKLMDLRNDKSMFKQGTPPGFLQALIAEMGVDSAKANSFSENQQNILASIQNQRLSVSGVDVDEEAMNIVRYKNAYNLSAKIVSTMNEIYDRLINYMGV